jgi:hypothetical protein
MNPDMASKSKVRQAMCRDIGDSVYHGWCERCHAVWPMTALAGKMHFLLGP